MTGLDLEAVRVFVLLAEFRNFTRVAEVLRSSQAAVSLKLQRLERQVDQRLLDRTPRLVRLSAAGAAFLEPARELLHSQERALAAFRIERRRMTFGIGQLLLGNNLSLAIRSLDRHDASVTLEMRVGPSRELMTAFDDGKLDAAMVFVDDDRRRKGKLLFTEQFDWYAADHWSPPAGKPLPLATQGKGCGLRTAAVRALDAASIAWTEVFVGQGAATLAAAAQAGVALALLTSRTAPPGTRAFGAALSLPPPPRAKAVLFSNTTDPRERSALASLTQAFRTPRS